MMTRRKKTNFPQDCNQLETPTYLIIMEKQEKDIKTLEADITAAVSQYIDNESEYTDNAHIAIDPQTLEVSLVDSDADMPEAALSGCDHYPVMEFVRMCSSEPGLWEPDAGAVALAASGYATEA